MGGIVLARFSNAPNAISLTLIVIVIALCLVRKARWLGLAIGVLVIGFLLYAARYRVTSATDLRRQFTGEPELVTVRGTIVETPSPRDFYSASNSVVYTHALLQVREIARNKQWIPATGQLATRTRGELSSDFSQNRQVQVIGVLERPPRAAAPGLFDYRAYLEHQRIFFQLKSDSTNDWQLLSFESLPLPERFRRWAELQLQRGLPHDKQLDLILAMTLGMRSALSGEASEPFMRTGTLHIFAVSGLHVACIAGFILFLLQWCGLSREHAGLSTLPLIWFYTLATGWQSSAIRAALMFSVIIAGGILKRPSDLLNSTAAAAVLILLFQPEQLFQTGFQLSFVVVASIALLLPAIQKFRPAFLSPDPFLPRSLLPRWRIWSEPLWKFAGAMLAVSLASWIGSMPLTAYYFNIVTVSSFLANLVAVPLSSVSLASTVFSLLLPPLGPFFNYIAWVFMWYTTEFTQLCAQIPFGYFYVPKPNPLFFLFYFAGMMTLFIPGLRSGRRHLVTIPTVGVLGLVWLASVLVGRPLATITVLPCAGTPTLFEIPHEPTLLVDASSERDAGYMLKRFLRARGLGSVDHLLLTHGDAQNVGGFTTIWEEFRPQTVITTRVRARSPYYRDALRVLEQLPARWKTVAAGEQFGDWTIFHPPNGRGAPRADDNSVVFKRRIGSWRILHVADLGADGQKQLLESGEDLAAEILIAGMPERDEPLPDELLAAVRPRAIVLGTTRYPYTSEGTPELKARLERTGASVLCLTDTDAVTIRIHRDACRISGMSGTAIELRPGKAE